MTLLSSGLSERAAPKGQELGPQRGTPAGSVEPWPLFFAPSGGPRCGVAGLVSGPRPGGEVGEDEHETLPEPSANPQWGLCGRIKAPPLPLRKD